MSAAWLARFIALRTAHFDLLNGIGKIGEAARVPRMRYASAADRYSCGLLELGGEGPAVEADGLPGQP